MNAAEALRLGAARLAEAGVDEPRRTAELMLAKAIERDRVYLIAHPEAEIEEAALAQYQNSIERREAREPLQYILGRQEFLGLDFAVGPGALIPRPETELLVERALERIESGDRVCDVGTGSGAIAVAIAVSCKRARVMALDIAYDALDVARRNARAHSVDVPLCQADLLEALRDCSMDVVVCNPPYVAESSRQGLQRELAFEPAAALFGGSDGLDAYRRLIPGAARVLRPGGPLLMEIGYDSLPGVLGLLRAGEWSTPEVYDDLAGIPRVVAAERNPS